MRVGMVGLGYATKWLHVPAAKALDDAIVVGGADPSPAQRQAWEEVGAGPAYETLSELLEQQNPDLVVVGTPPDSHADLCVEALASGAHVICEKPFVEDLGQADRVIRAAHDAGRHVAVNQEFRYMPAYAALRDVVGPAGYGRPVFIQATQFMDLAPWDEKVAWRAAMPNRTLFEGGVHIVDLIYMVVGRLPRSVYAATSSGPDRQNGADAIHLVTLDFGDGLLGQITIDRLSKSGTRYLDLRLDLDRATVRASHGGRAYAQIGIKRAQRPGIRIDFGLEGMSWVEQGHRRKTIGRNPRNVTVSATAALYQDAVGAMREGREPATSAQVARDTLAIIEAAYKSAESASVVHL